MSKGVPKGAFGAFLDHIKSWRAPPGAKGDALEGSRDPRGELGDADLVVTMSGSAGDFDENMGISESGSMGHMGPMEQRWVESMVDAPGLE